MYPATKPASSAARKPPDTPVVSPFKMPVKFVPLMARTPPAKPTARPGISAMDMAT